MGQGLRPARRLLQAGALAGLCAAALPAWAACGTPVWSLAAGAEHSRWREFDAQRRGLLREQGTLGTLVLAVQTRCAAVDWQLVLTQASGRRDYDGRNSTGGPLATSSRIDRSTLALGVWLPLAGGWLAGAGLDYRQLDREIASADAVLGYAERFSDWQALASLRHQRRLGATLALAAEFGLGAGPPGRLALQLPHADAAVLRLGSSRVLQAGLTLRGTAPAAPSSDWQWQLIYRTERFGAGPPQVLLRQGLVVGGAAQPETRRSALGLQGGFSF